MSLEELPVDRRRSTSEWRRADAREVAAERKRRRALFAGKRRLEDSRAMARCAAAVR